MEQGKRSPEQEDHLDPGGCGEQEVGAMGLGRSRGQEVVGDTRLWQKVGGYGSHETMKVKSSKDR